MKNELVCSQFRYALLGSGRLARHLKHYFGLLGLTVVQWSRHDDPQEANLAEVIRNSTHVLLAVSDRAIEELARKAGDEKILVHFSGAKNVPGVYAAHPLMTFGEELQAEEWYRKIPFVIDEGNSLGEVLPGLPNPNFPLSAEQRPLYHALCSLAGNSAYLLWQNIGLAFEEKLNLPRHLLTPFLQQVVVNAASGNPADFTGPVARGDWGTVGSHLTSLKENPALLGAYKEYLNLAAYQGHPVPEALV